jgi:DNA-binding transcriptional MerR regulator
MNELTVKQLAALSGVTVRTLHHYDELGLLRPASVGANGYRYYGRAELLRLQRAKLAAERERYGLLIETIDRTIAELNGEAHMSNADLYQGFSAEQGGKLQELEEALAGALRNGVDPASDAVDALLRRHRAGVAAMWGRSCSAEAYSGLADLYLAHPDFVARYERIGAGLAQYLAGAMKIHAARWSVITS